MVFSSADAVCRGLLRARHSHWSVFTDYVSGQKHYSVDFLMQGHVNSELYMASFFEDGHCIFCYWQNGFSKSSNHCCICVNIREDVTVKSENS